jgi:hypothetical protein
MSDERPPTSERVPPAEGAKGVPLQPPRQGDIDTPGPHAPGDPSAREQARRALDREQERKGEAPPRYDAAGKLTRYGMEQAIKEGGSVMVSAVGFGGTAQIIDRLEDLPSEADLAAGDEEREAQVAAALDAQIAALAAQKHQMQARGRAAREETKAKAQQGADKEGPPEAGKPAPQQPPSQQPQRAPAAPPPKADGGKGK